MRWLPAGPLDRLADHTAVHVDLAGHPVCLARSRGTAYAMLDQCSHGQVLLSEGDVEDGYVECWLHGSRFRPGHWRPDRSSGHAAGPCVPG
jgi:3-phenylpropionate/trans-cinnamate dioxygenase ferredoxin subunit